MQLSFDEFRFRVFPGVYEPAEDSFMLALEAKKLKGDLLDIGTGCGIQAIVAKKAKATGADINPSAVENAKANARANGSCANFLVSDLFSDVSGKFDAIVFNPPYLPTSAGEKLEGLENLAYDGGEDGREVLDRFLAEFSGNLRREGKVLLLLSTLSDNGETRERLSGLGFSCKELARRHVGLMEELFVLEARRADA
jgi:release factor glutamine methyltransferase